MSNSTPIADINTTPLVDVMLVLLIIFMITAPMMQRQTAVKIPLTGPISEQPPPSPPKAVLIELAADGTLRWEGEVASLAGAVMQSKALARRLATSGQSLRVYLRNDPEARYDQVVALITKLTAADLTDIRFAEISPMP